MNVHGDDVLDMPTPPAGPLDDAALQKAREEAEQKIDDIARNNDVRTVAAIKANLTSEE